MTEAEARQAFLDELSSVAPDIDPATVADDDNLQEDLDLDSMDILNLVSALHARLGLDIPETDYHQIATPALAVRYLCRHAPDAPRPEPSH